VTRQSEGERRVSNREAVKHSRQRKKVQGKWLNRLGDPETAKAKLAADDMLAEEFRADLDGYPWPERGNDSVSLISPATPRMSYGDACDLLDPDMGEDDSVSSVRPLLVDLDTQAKRGNRTQDDINRAESWDDMQAEACNEIARAKRSYCDPDDPPVYDHMAKLGKDGECARCGWKAVTL
jgi:hypothetical protein